MAPVLPQLHVKDPGHSAKSAGDRLHLNTHAALTLRSWSGLTMPLSGYSHHHHHYPSRQLAYRAATKLLHPCLSLASPWMVPQLWFIFFISASTVLRQVVFGRPRIRFPSGVQWIATLVMEMASSCSMCLIQCHHFLVMTFSISSCWHHAKRSWLEMVLGQKMRWIFLRFDV